MVAEASMANRARGRKEMEMETLEVMGVGAHAPVALLVYPAKGLHPRRHPLSPINSGTIQPQHSISWRQEPLSGKIIQVSQRHFDYKNSGIIQ